MEAVNGRGQLLDAGIVALAGATLGQFAGELPLLLGLAGLSVLRLAMGLRPRLGRARLRRRVPRLLRVVRLARPRRRRDADTGQLQLVLPEAPAVHDDAPELAVIDALTGLPNRRGVERSLDDACRQAVGANQPLGVLVFQVRDAGQVRRLFGPQAARDVLRQTGTRLSKALGDAGLVGRWAGEEFVAVVPGLRAEAAALLAERFRRVLEADPYRLSSGRRVPVAMAAGWAASPRDGISGQFLVSRAQGRAAAARSDAGALALS
ncbi:MAG TPA: GGDEF domain-containing protein [Egibacteraceae bacterium]|nr:GGDEF domain-containing protein [Egibacteraceae bacterium]